MKKVIIPTWFISLFLFVSSFPIFGQQPTQPPQYRQETAPVSIHRISPHVYEVRGGIGANCSFIVGDEKVFVVDAKMTDQSAKEMIAAINQVTNKPISHILLTHSDGDHVNGLGGFSQKPDIIAHANSAKHIEAANQSADEKIPLPNVTFFNRMHLFSGSLMIDLLYFGPAHTDGDIVIFIPGDNVAILGDLFFKARDPLIHMHKNGNSFGLVDVLEEIVDLDAETYLSGHAEPVDTVEIENLRKRISKTQDKIKSMVQEHKSLDEVKQALDVSTEQSRWRSLAEVIYLELTEEKRK